MRSILGRMTASVALLGLGGIFLAYAVMSLQFSRNDPAPDAGRLPASLHPEAWAQEGHRRYYVDLDADAASDFYRGAILSNPLLIRAWLALAEIEMVTGREPEGRRVLETLAPFLDRVSTWKWKELLLAFEIRDEAYFERCFNFVLHRLPNRAREACYLAGSLWNGWAGTLPHVAAENREVFLKELMRAKEVEVALSLWYELVAQAGGPSQDLHLRFSEFLLSQKRLREAKEVWGGTLGGEAFGVFDGGFEGPPLGQSFGWRWTRQADVAVERSMEAPHEGSTCMHLRFKGTRNVAFHHVHQIVPVDGGGDYILSFARRSRNLTTDQGVALEVNGYGCKGLNQRSEPVLGSSPWQKEELLFSVPEGCEAAVIRIVRKESLKFDSKISGDYWLDGLSLKRVHY
ncbi:MAG: hypothetical protein MUC41_14435 [Syntrophobacteraceae bacterium]|jgi:hypothetical protein|nr:hypothetical protein [Syntrophobacteraceae bacterium]